MGLFGFDDWFAYQTGWNEADAIASSERIRAENERNRRERQLERECFEEEQRLERRIRELEERKEELEREEMDRLLYGANEDREDFSSVFDEFGSYEDGPDFSYEFGDAFFGSDDDLYSVATEGTFGGDDWYSIIYDSSIDDDDEDEFVGAFAALCDSDNESFVSGHAVFPDDEGCGDSGELDGSDGSARLSTPPLSSVRFKREKKRIYVADASNGDALGLWKNSNPSDCGLIRFEHRFTGADDRVAVLFADAIGGFVPNEEADLFASLLDVGGGISVTRLDVSIKPDKKQAGAERAYVWMTVQLEPPAHQVAGPLIS